MHLLSCFNLHTTLAAVSGPGSADITLLLTLPLLLIASGFFSGTETALFSINVHQRQRLTHAGGLVAQAVNFLLADSRMLLITLILGNMIVNVLYFVISSSFLLTLERTNTHPAIIAACSILSLIAIIIAGEVLPKMIASLSPARWIRICVIPMYLIHQFILPIRYLVGHFVVTPLARLISPTTPPPQLSSNELENMVLQSHRRGIIDQREQEMLSEVIELNRLKVRDVMIPRVDMVAYDLDDPIEQLDELIRMTQVTKLPVYQDDLDHIVGVIYVRQYLLAKATRRLDDIRKLIRQVRFVPEIQRVDRLLEDFRKGHTHIAVAVDEFGGTAGFVTLKDVVERLVGDLDMDEAPGEGTVPEAEQIDDKTWRVNGRLSIHDWADAFSQQVPMRISTVGGLIMSRLGRLPQVGDIVQLGNLKLTVESMTDKRVENIILQLQPTSDAPPPRGDQS